MIESCSLLAIYWRLMALNVRIFVFIILVLISIEKHSDE